MQPVSSTLSFEVFPPNTQVGTEKLLTTLEELQQLAPDFISVTCSNNRQTIEETTLKVADYIHTELQVPTIAHLPAAYLDQAQVQRLVTRLDQIGIHQILALRGDIIPELPPKQDFTYASDLIDYVKQQAPHFHISGACYPETHPESQNRIEDVKNLRRKVAGGCDQLITQLFFDNELFYQFQESCDLADIKVPILAGIMPIVNRKQALRLIKTTNTKLPRKFLAILEKYEHDPIALKEAGLAYAIDQIIDLATQDVAGIHLYTMNNAEVAKHIYYNTKNVLKGQIEVR
ncbi:methylenetetrahydrofolate reductase [NAD(P)H] [Enterococcus avium]|uniref:Methylenetetrahydrofolate reductase n=1 Tax=Enterococcus avium TaxID=33945 RepID=A0AAW8RYH8_ENTAV|nr:methylenetetrahydrofolate reductase [NAD(P)H] [Enterococcus avium]MCB6918753.1 methylenetetrahydrofolate reductase [NAD(P)H] [Enterococcus avium]MCQ4962867.1 methylenetetrahydrofolate reductase [NAD(P)H] [Enterococcus avium]MDB1725233.1 methylenetetrahydrofolate reductase [NAD(P)H] [Enterococcus avium]MDT2391791.1 methylenetetrahydrofolate reductase [NAD(P)H] [Enterococcus avium]MDT2396071.1 methylenetetrahydrofolate reductase [NAD(P)H] [Enterococcus avium]